MDNTPALANILRHPVFVEEATHIELAFWVDLFANKVEKQAQDSFILIFVAAGEPIFQCLDIVSYLKRV